MDKPDTLKAIEDLLNDSGIPMNEYKTCIVRDNGNYQLTVRKKGNSTIIDHMYLFSEIFNSVTENWSAKIIDQVLTLVVE